MIDKLGAGLEAAAVSEDGIIEAIVHKEYPFLVAVQWHPEMMFQTDQEQLKLFQLFVDFIKNKQACAQVSSWNHTNAGSEVLPRFIFLVSLSTVLLRSFYPILLSRFLKPFILLLNSNLRISSMTNVDFLGLSY